MTTIFIGLAAAVGVLIIFMGLASNRGSQDPDLHMDAYAPGGGSGKSGLVDGMLEGFNRRLTRKGGRTSGLADELMRADLKLRVSEYVILVIGLIVLLVLIIYLRFHNVFLAAFGIPVGYFVPGFYLKFRQRRQIGRASCRERV